ncbi:hypothetical protein J2Y58_003344 [Sphingomonas sp. BE138]|uniref:hypothetical protein n=1 Tax=Sphingomonas sp. BE138 TaxID=2817845 RepID=UPI0028649977|nr:hypothetical protein [Sphingomonas sp. BE138]MDR6789969.1 hypothetical protein [Sphingomonas sp. BE138]
MNASAIRSGSSDGLKLGPNDPTGCGGTDPTETVEAMHCKITARGDGSGRALTAIVSDLQLMTGSN